ncbi:hypothetical protein Bca101_019357 [Brassica carinata]
MYKIHTTYRNRFLIGCISKPNHEIKNEAQTEIKSPKRKRPKERQEDILSPPPRRRISIIMRGSIQTARIDTAYNEEHDARKDNATCNPIRHAPVTFNNLDAERLDAPHNGVPSVEILNILINI